MNWIFPPRAPSEWGHSQRMGFRPFRSSSKIHGILIFNVALMETESCCMPCEATRRRNYCKDDDDDDEDERRCHCLFISQSKFAPSANWNVHWAEPNKMMCDKSIVSFNVSIPICSPRSPCSNECATKHASTRKKHDRPGETTRKIFIISISDIARFTGFHMAAAHRQ